MRERSGSGAPFDPSRTGGVLIVYEGNNATFIEMWQHVPAAK